MKISSFMVNYRKELRMEVDIRKKEKVEKAMEFVEKIKKVQEKVVTALRKTQKEIKRQANKGQREVKEWKKRDKVILSSKDLVFKKRPVKKLMERYVELYVVEEIISKNVVKLKLPAFIKVHLIINVSRVVKYRELVKRKRVKELKPVKVDRIEEWEVEKILNKRKVRGVIKYLVR